MEKTFICPYCARENSILLEESPENDEFVSDCEVCCRPVVIRVKNVLGDCEIEVRAENE